MLGTSIKNAGGVAGGFLQCKKQWSESAKFAGQILSPEVRVALQHLKGLVASDRGHLHDVEVTLKEAGGGLVAEVMEADTLEKFRVGFFVRL